MSRYRYCGGLCLLILVLVAPVLAQRELSPAEYRRNAQLLARWKADPEHYAKLKIHYRIWSAMSPVRQERIRELDRELHDLDSDSQQRLWGVLERYHAWFERLPKADQERIQTAMREEKLGIIHELREQEWIERLPYLVQQRLTGLTGEEREKAIARLKEEEAKRHARLRRALKLRPGWGARPGRPMFVEDLPIEVQKFVQTTLRPYLSMPEFRRLESTEGTWPGFAHTLVELADRHPILPPPPKSTPVLRYLDLPVELRKALPRRRLDMVKGWDEVRKTEGTWPDFALAFTRVAKKHNIDLPQQLGACRPDEFSPEVQAYLTEKLYPVLDDEEHTTLEAKEGTWPDYPLYLHELAKKYRKPIPGLSLPGSTVLWTRLRSSYPEVPDKVLRDFALTELSKNELKRLRLSIDDPASRERLKQAYYKKYPDKLRKARIGSKR